MSTTVLIDVLRAVGASAALILSTVAGCLGSGCAVSLEGRGLSGVGYKSSSEVYVYSEAIATDPDAKSHSEIAVFGATAEPPGDGDEAEVTEEPADVPTE